METVMMEIWAIGALFTYGLLLEDFYKKKRSALDIAFLVVVVLVLWPAIVGIEVACFMERITKSLESKKP